MDYAHVFFIGIMCRTFYLFDLCRGVWDTNF